MDIMALKLDLVDEVIESANNKLTDLATAYGLVDKYRIKKVLSVTGEYVYFVLYDVTDSFAGNIVNGVTFEDLEEKSIKFCWIASNANHLNFTKDSLLFIGILVDTGMRLIESDYEMAKANSSKEEDPKTPEEPTKTPGDEFLEGISKAAKVMKTFLSKIEETVSKVDKDIEELMKDLDSKNN